MRKRKYRSDYKRVMYYRLIKAGYKPSTAKKYMYRSESSINILIHNKKIRENKN